MGSELWENNKPTVDGTLIYRNRSNVNLVGIVIDHSASLPASDNQIPTPFH